VSAQVAGVRSYEELGEAAFGQAGKTLVCTMIVMQNLGAMTSYLVVIGDIGPSMVKLALGSVIDPMWYDRDVFLTILTIGIVLPLSGLREIGLLGYTSSLSISFLAFFAVFVIYKNDSIPCSSDPTRVAEWGCEPIYAKADLDLFLALPTMCFSFLCHTCLLPVFKELDAADQLGRTHRPRTRIQQAARFAIGGSASLYFVVSLFGYLTFYNSTDTDLLTSYLKIDGSHDTLTILVQSLLLISFVVTVPLINFPVRRALEMGLFQELPFSWGRHILETVIVIGTVLILAIKIPSITTVFALVGATSSVTLVFILPCSIYLRVEEGVWSDSHKLSAVVMLVGGAFIGVVSFFGVIYSWVKPN